MDPDASSANCGYTALSFAEWGSKKCAKGNEYLFVTTPAVALDMLPGYGGDDIIYLDEWDVKDAEFHALKAVCTYRCAITKDLWVYGACALPTVEGVPVGMPDNPYVEYVNVSSIGHSRIDIELTVDSQMRDEIIIS